MTGRQTPKSNPLTSDALQERPRNRQGSVLTFGGAGRASHTPANGAALVAYGGTRGVSLRSVGGAPGGAPSVSGRRHSLPRMALAPFSPASAGGNAPGFVDPAGNTRMVRELTDRRATLPTRFELRSGDAASAVRRSRACPAIDQSLPSPRLQSLVGRSGGPSRLRPRSNGTPWGSSRRAEMIGPMSKTRTSRLPSREGCGSVAAVDCWERQVAPAARARLNAHLHQYPRRMTTQDV